MRLTDSGGGREGSKGGICPRAPRGGRLQGVGGNFFRSDMHLIAVKCVIRVTHCNLLTV